MKKAIAKLLKKYAEERLELPDKVAVKKQYKKFKKAWKANVKNGNKI